MARILADQQRRQLVLHDQDDVAPMRAVIAVIHLADEPARRVNPGDDRVAAGDPISAAAEHLVQRDFDRDRLDSLDFHGSTLQGRRRRRPIIGRSSGAAYPFRAALRCPSRPLPGARFARTIVATEVRDAGPGMIEGMMPLRPTAATHRQKRWGAAMAVLLLAAFLAAPGPARAGDFVDSVGRRALLPEPIERVMPANPTRSEEHTSE